MNGQNVWSRLHRTGHDKGKGVIRMAETVKKNMSFVSPAITTSTNTQTDNEIVVVLRLARPHCLTSVLWILRSDNCPNLGQLRYECKGNLNLESLYSTLVWVEDVCICSIWTIVFIPDQLLQCFPISVLEHRQEDTLLLALTSSRKQNVWRR